MGTIFYPNAATSEIIGFASALTGDATSLEQIGMTEATMRSKVLAEGEVIQQEEGGYSLGYYVDASQPWIFATVGKNAEGKAGNVNWIICKAPATTRRAEEEMPPTLTRNIWGRGRLHPPPRFSRRSR